MFLSRHNFSTVYIHKQHSSSTVFDILLLFKPSNRFNTTKHILISIFYMHIKCLCICCQNTPPNQILLKTTLLILPWTKWLTNMLRKVENTDGSVFLKMNLSWFRSFCQCSTTRCIMWLHLSISVLGKKHRSHNLIHFRFGFGTHLLLPIMHINPTSVV